MELCQDFNNYIHIGNIHIFVDITTRNLEYAINFINDTTCPIFHIFLTHCDIAEDNEALEKFIDYRVKVRRELHKPANVTIYYPLWHRDLSRWTNKVVGQYPDRFGIKSVSGIKFKVAVIGSNEHFVFEYPNNATDQLTAIFGYENTDENGNSMAFESLGSFSVSNSSDRPTRTNSNSIAPVLNRKIKVGSIVYFDINDANVSRKDKGEKEFKVGTVEAIYISSSRNPDDDICSIVQPSGIKQDRHFNTEISIGRMALATDTMICSSVSELSESIKAVRHKRLINNTIA